MAKKTEAPEAVIGGTITIGGTHGHRAISVQEIEIGPYVFYRGVQSGALYERCGRCYESRGHMPGFEHVAGGVCFECGGQGAVSRKEGADVEGLREVVRKRLLAKAARERKAAREAEAAEQAARTWAEAHADLAAALAAFRARYNAASDALVGNQADGDAWDALNALNTDLASIASQAARKPLSDAQVAYATTLLARQAETDAASAAEAARKAAAKHLGTVKQALTVTGTVKRALTIEVQSYSGYGTENKRLVVVDVEGSDVVVFSTAEWAWDAEAGQTLTLTGVVKEHSEYDGAPQTKLGGRIKVG